MITEEKIRIVEEAIDQDVRLLVLTTRVTLDQFNRQLPGIRRALAVRAVGALERRASDADQGDQANDEERRS